MIRYGLFDVDCLELNEDGDALSFRPRVSPIISKLEPLYEIAEKNKIPFVFSTCCSGKMLQPHSFDDVLYVPLDKNDVLWRENLNDFNRFYLAKNAYGDPKINAACRAFDMFQDNANLEHLFSSLSVDTWVVFGNGFDYCIGSAVKGLLTLKHNVLLLEDVRISSAGGNESSEAKTVKTLTDMGAKLSTLEGFLNEVRQ